jgi:DNA processing protein
MSRPVDRNLHGLLRLQSVPGIGSQRMRALMARFRSPEVILNASMRELMEVDGIEKTLAHHIRTAPDGRFADEQIFLLDKANARIVTFWDGEYPSLLKKIFDPPVLLFMRGEFAAADCKGIAIVGTRSPSAYGRLMAQRFAGELARNGLTVVSGLARGVDTIAHREVLAQGGRTIAVLGSGVDVIYPDENSKLADQIAGQGAVVSEFSMGAKPDAPHFPRRNRIISGLCVATLVIEAGQSSGALITADCALEQDREVFAIPGNINNPKSYGCNRLIQQGAKLVHSIEDIWEEIGATIHANTDDRLPNLALTEQEKKIYSLLSQEPLHIDLIAQKSGLPTSQALATLLTLELKNLVRQVVGKNFVRA